LCFQRFGKSNVEKTMVSQPTDIETIVFTMVIFKKHNASQLKTSVLGSQFNEKTLNVNS